MKVLIGMPSADSWGGPAASEPPFVAALRKKGFEIREETYVYGDKEKANAVSRARQARSRNRVSFSSGYES